MTKELIEQSNTVSSFAWALIMETAASFEVASYSISDEDAKKSAEGAIKYARYMANKYYTSPPKQEIPTVEQEHCCPECGCHFVGEFPFEYHTKNKTSSNQKEQQEVVGVVVNERGYSEVFVDFFDKPPLPNGTKLYTSPPKQAIPDGWVADPDTIPAEIIKVTKDAISIEFGITGTDGYYKRILDKVFKAMLASAPPKQAIPDGWISVKDRLPNQGDSIEGLNDFTMITWSEVFDSTEPSGYMTHWRVNMLNASPTNTEVGE